MKWLTLTEIKQQLRIEADYTDEDALLTRYGNSAEAVVLNITGRTYDISFKLPEGMCLAYYNFNMLL